MSTKNKTTLFRILEIFAVITAPLAIAVIFLNDHSAQELATFFHLPYLWLAPLLAAIPLYFFLGFVYVLWNWKLGDLFETLTTWFRLRWGHLDGEKRSRQAYKNGIERLITESKSIYFQLISGYTMTWDDQEEFILKVLKEMTPEDRRYKDFKILLLNPESAAFKDRAEWFVKEMQKNNHKGRVATAAEYVKRCKEIEAELRALGAQIAFYDYEPIWRIQMFDDVALVSYYSESKGGHLTTANVFKRDGTDGMYYGFLKRFQLVFNGIQVITPAKPSPNPNPPV
jgi:hypothetical protein